MNSECSAFDLQSALAGNLPPDREEWLHRHLEQCAACSTAIEQLAGGTVWCEEVSAMLTGDELDDEAPSREEWSEADFTVEHLEASDEPDVLGRLGDYDVLEIIGRGGMGVVLKGFDRELNRYVAIKALAPHLAQSPLAKKRFIREARAAAAVVHPNVMAIHRVQPSGRLPFLVMPLVSGESLAQRLVAQGRLELQETLRIAMQAAAALAAAHEQGLVHRDVKPANILLEKGVERALLSDFGLARAADDVSMTRWGIIAGTPQYMSPEQAKGEPLDGRSDLFSLGCVLYEMATGVSPFKADSTMATLRRLIDDPPQALAALNPELPPWFVGLVERLLEKDPARRFSSAKEVSQLLEGCLAHVQQPGGVPLPAIVSGTLRVPMEGGTRSVPDTLSRKPRTVGALVMLALLGISLFAVGVVTTNPPNISGQWSGEDWGKVVLTEAAPGHYAGKYSETVGKTPGKIELKWSRIERQFNGAWGEGDDRFGTLSVKFADNEIRGALTTDSKSKINPATPRLAPFVWTRLKTLSFGSVTERAVRGGINFDSGKLVTGIPLWKSYDHEDGFTKTLRLMKTQGIDAYREGPYLRGFDMRVRVVENSAWETTTAEQLIQALDTALVKPQQILDSGGVDKASATVTYAFQTREGSRGMLQVLGVGDDGAKIRYKLVRPSASAASSAENEKVRPNAPPVISAENGKGLAVVATAERFVDLLVQGEFDKTTDYFDQTKKKSRSPEAMKKLWEQLAERGGKFTGRGRPRREQIPSYDVVSVPGKWERIQSDFRFLFDKQGRIAELSVPGPGASEDSQPYRLSTPLSPPARELLPREGSTRPRGAFYSVTYPVGDLVLMPAAVVDVPAAPPSGPGSPAPLAPAQSAAGGAAAPPIGLGAEVQLPSDKADFDSITELIFTTVAPDSWLHNGGKGTISHHVANLTLSVFQTQKVHEEITDLLEQLRRVQDVQVVLKTRFIELDAKYAARLDLNGEVAALDAHRIAELIERVEGDRRTNVWQAPMMTLFDGQAARYSNPFEGDLPEHCQVQATVDENRTLVKLGLTRDGNSKEKPTIVRVKDGESAVVDITFQNDRANHGKSPSSGKKAVLIMITPQIVVQVQEEDRIDRPTPRSENLDVARAKCAAAKAKAEDDVDIRYAMAAAKVAKAEYEYNKKANTDAPGTVPLAKLGELLLKCNEADLAIERAKGRQRIDAKRAEIAKAVLEVAQAAAKKRNGDEKAALSPTASGPAAVPSSQNILKNSGIEKGNDSPDNWQQGAAIDGVTYSWCKNAAFEGKASLCIEKTAERYFPIAQWWQTVDRRGDRPALRVSAQVKAEKMTKAVVDVLFLDEKDNRVSHKWAVYIGGKADGDPPANHDWKLYCGTVRIPKEAKKLCIGLQVYGPGKVWFDDVRAGYANDDAKATVSDFLDAVRRGDEAKAKSLLTEVARQKRDEQGRDIAPGANGSVKIEVDDATFPTPDHDIAHVSSRWIHKDETGKPRTDKATWVCRLESGHWRVAGFAAFDSKGEGRFMNFEDPDYMARQQMRMKEEMEDLERRGRNSIQ